VQVVLQVQAITLQQVYQMELIQFFQLLHQQVVVMVHIQMVQVDNLVDQGVDLLFQVLQEQEIPLLLVPLKEILEEQD
jgi:hypothetical protein